jgi:hypothetical protein
MRTISVVLSLLALAFPAAAADEPSSQPVELSYRMAVGADGKAATLTPLRELPPAIESWIQARVRSYTFAPATVNGQPQPATTTLRIVLAPVQGADGKAAYRITDVATGPRLVKGRFDYYPRTIGAGYIRVAYDAKGKVTKAEPIAGMPFVGGAAFRKWALSLARSFRFEPETVAGAGVPDAGIVPINYCLDGKCPSLPPLPMPAGHALEGGLVASSVLALKSPMDGS